MNKKCEGLCELLCLNQS